MLNPRLAIIRPPALHFSKNLLASLDSGFGAFSLDCDLCMTGFRESVKIGVSDELGFEVVSL